MYLKTLQKSKLFLSLFAAMLFNLSSNFAQEISITSPDRNLSHLENIIKENTSALIDFDESAVLERYNSFTEKEISFEDYLIYEKISAIQKTTSHHKHKHDEIPAKAFDCTNFGFENGSFATGWLGQTGTRTSTTNTYNVNALVSNGLNAPANDPLSRHTILNTPPGNADPSVGPIIGYDPNAIDPSTNMALIPYLPSGGGNYSVRLGNSNAGYGLEKLSYSIEVTAANSYVYYQYAVILNILPAGLSTHGINGIPFFQATLKDSNGTTLPIQNAHVFPLPDSTNQSFIYANSGGFIANGSYSFTKWKSLTFDLSSYIGQTILLEFETGDCNLGGHYGYAYVNTGCGVSPALQAKQCFDNNVSNLSGPTGHSNYQWYGPNNPTLAIANATSSNYQVNSPVSGDLYYLEFTDSSTTNNIFQDIMVSLDSLSFEGDASVKFCEGNLNGTVKAASGKYNYQWYDDAGSLIPGETNMNLTVSSNSLGDTYHVSFTEGGCKKWQSVVINEQAHRIDSLEILGSCANQANGTIQISTASPATTLKYTLAPSGAIDFNGEFLNLVSDNYQVTIEDLSNNCTTILDTIFFIPESNLGYAGIGDTITICKNEPFDLFQALTGNSGIAGAWSGPFDNALINGTMPTNALNTAGSYSYTYLVNDTICTSSTATVMVEVLNNCTFGLEEFLGKGNVILFPNPSTDFFKITFDDELQVRDYSLFDGQGRKVKTGIIEANQSELLIDMRNHAAGEYQIHFFNKKELIGAKKIMKL